MRSTRQSSKCWGASADRAGYRAVSELKKLATIIDWTQERRGVDTDQPMHVLELGCGTGSISVPLARLGFDVLGTDVDAVSVARAAERNHLGHAQFRVLDLQDVVALEALPSFDVVICSEVIQYLSDPGRALRHMRRLVRRSGYLILTTPNACGLYALSSDAVGRARSTARAQLKRLGLLNAATRLSRARVEPSAERERPSLNASLPRPRFLTSDRLRQCLDLADFTIREWRNSDFMSIGMLRRNPHLATLDCALADHLPRSLASGWYLKCE
jgi:2-polyprenyl-3-methyl-5-hydroxy-6-metoxy-1,4-benzoquinol methylase